jgi:hypothetical protein
LIPRHCNISSRLSGFLILDPPGLFQELDPPAAMVKNLLGIEAKNKKI